MSFQYVGNELELFAAARHWKAYLAAQLAPFIAGRVLEVGAGIGGNIPFLRNPSVTAGPRLSLIWHKRTISGRIILI